MIQKRKEGKGGGQRRGRTGAARNHKTTTTSTDRSTKHTHWAWKSDTCKPLSTCTRTSCRCRASRCSRPARSRRTRLVPAKAVGGGARPRGSDGRPVVRASRCCTVHFMGGEYIARGGCSVPGGRTRWPQHLAGRCSGDGRLATAAQSTQQPRPQKLG